jgi:hypothetical protein
MALSACGDAQGPPTASARGASEVAAHVVPVVQEPDAAAAKHKLENDPRAKSFLLHLRCRLSRCSLLVRLKRSRLLNALLN